MAAETICSEITGSVWKILGRPGDALEADGTLMVLESMKMESYVLAPRAGRIEAINVEVGANVAPGHVLVTLSPEAETNEGGQK